MGIMNEIRDWGFAIVLVLSVSGMFFLVVKCSELRHETKAIRLNCAERCAPYEVLRMSYFECVCEKVAQ